jgi:trimethylamine--corrinoid protein Co-methyltransferase
MVTRILRGVEVSDETLAKDLIAKMGFSGNYLFEQHTRRHVRELWKAQLGETGTFEAWKSSGAKSTVQKAQERVTEVLAAEPAEFPEELAREFDAIMAAAQRR